MANPASVFQVSEQPKSTSTGTNRLSHLEDDGGQLLELRTENGAVYLQPSRWQRIRLQWTFRHFHVLSPEVLSRADRRLIRELSKSAVVSPALPVPGTAVLGVLERARLRPPAPANRVVTLKPAPAVRQVLAARPEVPVMPASILSVDLKRKEPRALGVGAMPFRQWRDLAALATVGLVVILASVYRVPLVSSAVRMWNSHTTSEQAAMNSKPADLHSANLSPVLISPAAVWVAKVQKPRPWVAPSIPPVGAGNLSSSRVPVLGTVASTASSAASSAASSRPFVAELPPGYFAHPSVAGGNAVGELQLKALIGADGSVEDVTVLSGSPELAKAGLRAVRQWHYSPYRVQGSPVEVETQIKMSFFGPDAVSIASVANGSASQSR